MAGVKATGVNSGDACSDEVDQCSAASAAAEFEDYFGDNGFDNPFNTASAAVIDGAATTATTDCVSGNTRGLVYVSAATDELVVYGCEEFDDTTMAYASTPIEWKD